MSHSEPTTSMSMIAALRSGLDVMMARDDNVIVYGEDVGYFGGVFRVTEGLQAKYGKTRCFDAPISESGIVGTAIGMAAYGLRPAVERVQAAGITARDDFANYVPLPFIFPLFSAGYKRVTVQFTYIPGTYNNGNVLFAWLRLGF